MKRSFLIVVVSDPRRSPRAAEAIRVAAGIAPWKKVDVSVCLVGAAVLALDPFAEDLQDAPAFESYAPLLGGLARPVFLCGASPWLERISGAAAPVQEISTRELALIAAEADAVARF